jgi:NitT/TauT family transport system substrate-binding protein
MRHFAAALLLLLASAATASAEKITVSATRTTGSAGAYIAQAKGYFAQEGLEVDFAFFNAAQPVALAVASGDAVIGLTGLTAALYNMGAKQALKIIAGGSSEQAGYSNSAFVVSNESFAKGLRTPKDLGAVKNFGLTQIGSSYHYVMIRLAAKYGFNLSVIKLLPLQSFANVLSATIGNQVDAGLLQSNIALPAVHAGRVKIIGWAGDEVFRQSTGIFTLSNVTRTRRDMLERFLRAYIKGSTEYDQAFQQGSKDPALETKREELLKIITEYSQLPKEQVMEAVSFIDPAARLDVDDVRTQIASWKGLGMVDAAVEADGMIDLSFLPKAEPKPR